MFLLLEVVIVVAVLVIMSLVKPPGRWGEFLDGPLAIRLATLLVALGFAGGGVAGIVHLARDPLHTFDSAFVAYMLFGAMLVGGLSYTIGTIVWRGWGPFLLRVTGALLIMVPLTLSWVLVLAFPLALILFATLTEIPAPPPAAPVPASQR